MGVHLVENVFGGAAVGQHRALAWPRQVLRQREGAEMPQDAVVISSPMMVR